MVSKLLPYQLRVSLFGAEGVIWSPETGRAKSSRMLKSTVQIRNCRMQLITVEVQMTMKAEMAVAMVAC